MTINVPEKKQLSLLFGATWALLVGLFINVPAIGQEATDKPFVIQGQLVNSPERFLRIFFYEEDGAGYVIDTLRLDEEGNFYLKTWNVTHPHRTSIQQNRTQINGIYVAPGYDLTFTGDATDFQTLGNTLEITGAGAETNQYKLELVKAHRRLNDTTKYWELGPEELAVYAHSARKLRDSIASAVFSQTPVNDEYFRDFERIIWLDSQFLHAYYLLMLVNNTPLSYGESVDYLEKHFDKAVLDDFSRDEYLLSADYRNWALGEYVQYRKTLDTRKDSTLVKEKGYAIQNINNALRGKVRDYYLNQAVTSNILYVKSIESLHAQKDRLEPYIQSIANEAYVADIRQQIVDKELELLQTQVGKPASGFTLTSDRGETHSLADFKGKVVYIDFWASWCVPCRQENPDFKLLYEKYKDDARVQFVGIAVSDGEREWRKALAEDQPEWLQLYDGEGKVKTAYAAYAIPRFILIDKEGNLVDFDAPRPSSGEKLEALLLEEMAK